MDNEPRPYLHADTGEAAHLTGVPHDAQLITNLAARAPIPTDPDRPTATVLLDLVDRMTSALLRQNPDLDTTAITWWCQPPIHPPSVTARLR